MEPNVYVTCFCVAAGAVIFDFFTKCNGNDYVAGTVGGAFSVALAYFIQSIL